MAQPHHEEEEGPRVDPRAIVLFGAALICGTVYVGSLALAAGHVNVPEAMIDLSRSGLVTFAVSLFIKSGFERLAGLVRERSDRYTEGYSRGYVDGVARRQPQIPESENVLHAVK